MAALTITGVLSKKLRRDTFPVIFRTYEKLADGNALDEVKKKQFVDMLKDVPGPYPTTKEAREKSAAKYNMHPYEYKPFPCDHTYSGDYPDLPWIGAEAKDPFYPWDYPHFRRNHGEPVHKNFDIMTEDRYAFGVRQDVTDLQGTLIYWGTVAVFIALYCVMGNTSQPLMEKQWPYSDKPNYTFELVK